MNENVEKIKVPQRIGSTSECKSNDNSICINELRKKNGLKPLPYEYANKKLKIVD